MNKLERRKLTKKIWTIKNKDRVNEYKRKYVANNLEKVRKCKNDYRKKHLDTYRIIAKNYSLRHPEQVIAHIKSWNIPLSKKCFYCESVNKLERHHPNYLYPLLVITVCKICHVKLHYYKGVD